MSSREDEIYEMKRQETEDRNRFQESMHYFEFEENLQKSKIINDLIKRIADLEAQRK